MLLALPDSYSTLCTILNSALATTGGLSLFTDIVITHVLTEKKNTKLSSSQVALIAYTKGKGKLQSSKPLDRDKKKIKCNYCKKKGHIKSECQKLKADQAVKEGKSGDSGNGDLLVKVAVAKANEDIIQLFKAEILTGQKDILSKWIVDSRASTHMSSQQK